MRLKLVTIFSLIQVSLYAQFSVGIGTKTPHPSALLDISSPNKGLVISPMSQSSRVGITSPPGGLMVYDITSQRMFVSIDGTWRFLISNQYWTKSSTFDRVYTFDSIGLGTAAPLARLDVNGKVLIRTRVNVDDDLITDDTLRATHMISTGNTVSFGSALIGGDLTGQDGLILDNTAPIIQLQSDFDNKAFLQLSGDDLRLGTNSGNDFGKTIIRMAGNDIIQFDTLGGWTTLVSGAGKGNFNIGHKASRQVYSNDNMLPIAYGKINANATVSWSSANAAVTKIETGTYEVECFNARVSARSSITVTASSSLPRIATANYVSPGKFKVEIYDPVNRVFIDSDFNFIVHDPLNLF